MQNNFKWLAAGALSLFALQGYAQHSDITFDVDDNQLVIESEGHDHDHGDEDHAGGLLTSDGKWLFEADFGDFGQGPFATDDPGYASHETSGVLNSGEVIGFAGVGTLEYWDGFSWTTSTSATVSIEDVFGAETSFTSGGVANGSSTFIDAADSAGGFHSHIEYSINSDALSGAYLIEMMLLGFDETGSTQVYTPSESYYIAFNFGLDEETYEAGIDALVSEVPVPGGAVLMFSALSALGLIGRKRR